MIGDRVLLWESKYGRVVCLFDEHIFSIGYEEKDWAHLKLGMLIESDSGDAFHYETPDEDLELISRCENFWSE